MTAAARKALNDALATVKPAKRLKYGNKPVKVEGRTYASQKEARRAAELEKMLKAGEIHILREQPRYPLKVNGITVAHYVADFAYFPTSGGPEVIEDVKSPATRKNRLYRLKFKIMAAMGLHVVEV